LLLALPHHLLKFCFFPNLSICSSLWFRISPLSAFITSHSLGLFPISETPPPDSSLGGYRLCGCLFSLFFSPFWNRVSLCSPGWPLNCFILGEGGEED
jgi:hypothetical protein